MARTVPYTHYAYFEDKSAGEACGKELDARFDCLALVTRSAVPNPTRGRWLLRAGRTVDIDAPGGWHDEIEEVVERHGGDYDFGEACMFVPPSSGPVEGESP